MQVFAGRELFLVGEAASSKGCSDDALRAGWRAWTTSRRARALRVHEQVRGGERREARYEDAADPDVGIRRSAEPYPEEASREAQRIALRQRRLVQDRPACRTGADLEPTIAARSHDRQRRRRPTRASCSVFPISNIVTSPGRGTSCRRSRARLVQRRRRRSRRVRSGQRRRRADRRPAPRTHTTSHRCRRAPAPCPSCRRPGSGTSRRPRPMALRARP